MFSDEVYVTNAIHNGARGYVSKNSTSRELLKAVEEVCAGRTYRSTELPGRDAPVASSTIPHERLTNRELEVLQCVAKGLNTQEIASHLSLSERTIEVHRSRVLYKLGVRNHAEATLYAVTHGLVSLGNA